jgi:hypothetical protein
MQKLLYTMHFKGRMSSSASGSRLLRTTGSAISCVVTTTVCSQGVQSDVRPTLGGLAFLDSELRVTGADSFRQDGTVAFGEDSEHVLRFSSIGQGHLAASLEPGTMAGTATCHIDGGEGQFVAACGFLTSNFTLTDTGELDDFHSGLIFLPG